MMRQVLYIACKGNTWYEVGNNRRGVSKPQYGGYWWGINKREKGQEEGMNNGTGKEERGGMGKYNIT
jgi:hypothetical protein